MSKFIVTIKNQYDDLVTFRVEAPNRQSLYRSDKMVSPRLAEAMMKDPYVFGGYTKEDANMCRVMAVEKESDLVTLTV